MCNYKQCVITEQLYIFQLWIFHVQTTEKTPGVISCETSLRNSRVIYHHLTWDWFTTSLPLMCKQICLGKVCVWTAQTVHTKSLGDPTQSRDQPDQGAPVPWQPLSDWVIWQMFPLNDYGDRRLFPVQGKWDKSWIHKQPCIKPQLRTAWMLVILADQYNHTFHQKNKANHLLKMVDLCTVGSS